MKDVESYLKTLLKSDDIIIVGCSGGPDSMCLLHVLNKMKNDYNLQIICAHVNHNLRKESTKEEKMVQKYCEENDITFEYMKIKEYTNNKFTEIEGRQKRYEFFKKIVKKYNATYLMTAHHGDDLIETIMMRIVRGSNLKGYIGMPIITYGHDYTIVRPLLNSTKESIMEYLKKEKIEYAIDKTNTDDVHTRNRYRKHLLPFLKKEDKNVHKKYLQYSKELESTKEFINREVEKVYHKIVKNNEIDLTKLKKIDIYLQRKIVERVIEELQKDHIFNINSKELDNLMNFINDNTKGMINLANGFVGRISYNKLYIEKNTSVENYEFTFNEEINIMNKYIIKSVSRSKLKSNYVVRLNSKEIKLPLLVRNRRAGDTIKLKKVGTKKIKDVLIDSKVDTKLRNLIPIVTDSNNTILWLPGIKKSIFDKDFNEKYDIILKCTEEKNE